MLIAYCLLVISCNSAEEDILTTTNIHTENYMVDLSDQEFHNKLLASFGEASLQYNTLSPKPFISKTPEVTTECEPEPCGFSHEYTFCFQISDMPCGFADDCFFCTTVMVTQCQDGQDITFSFEQLRSHVTKSCIEKPTADDDWECLNELAYELFVQLFMENTASQANGCGGNQDLRTLSNTFVGSCTALCLTISDINDQPVFLFNEYSCGQTCCVTNERWCVNENGEVERILLSIEQQGTCSPYPIFWGDCLSRRGCRERCDTHQD